MPDLTKTDKDYGASSGCGYPRRTNIFWHTGNAGPRKQALCEEAGNPSRPEIIRP
ncbi:hypothetical protein AOE01nite_26550 [Acetobacter oeni]|uniref:Uncharacterized protein n=1 Tax=Acetobacter oeni TaxID=304077 RepID=A0A511XNA4_9PROT|nr:hypothetical protein [Acetobacter oeni]GEN64431.1 hypothetical protein AOE01nite_26550 [Acetobacter oeni]